MSDIRTDDQPAAVDSLPSTDHHGTIVTARACEPHPSQPQRVRGPVAAAAVTAGCVLALLTWQVLTHGPVTGWDQAARRAVQRWASEPQLHSLRAAALTLRNLGDPEVAIPLCLLAGAVAAHRTARLRPLLQTAVAALILGAVVWPAKIAIGRPGPGADPNVRPDWYGYFPSGHTASAALCYGAAALVLAAVWPRARLALSGAAALLVAVEGWALVWCDDHWVSDVLGSIALAVLVLPVLFSHGAAPRTRDAAAAAAPPEPPMGQHEDGCSPVG